MSPSDQLGSSIDSSLSHLQLQQVTSVSLFQPQSVYKQASWTQIIQYRLCSCLENISSSTSLHLTMPAAPGCSIPRWEDFVPEVLALCLTLLACLPKGRRSYFASPPCSCHCHNFITLLWCSFLLLLAWTAIRYHSSHLGLDAFVAQFRFLSVAQVPALASSLFPPGATLLNKTFVLLFITVLRTLSFLIPH